jgi:tetraacyldisaccharide 4'-kinase
MWRPPDFWNAGAPGTPAMLLAPLAALYAGAVRLRFALTSPARAAVPVICVGNPGLGGGGKTPTAIAVARRLDAMGAAPHFLTRGYGGRLAGPVTVDRARHSAADVGDEPLLLAAVAPTHVARDRVAGARAAAKAGAGAIVMDDGFQNPELGKDCALLVVDGAIGIGNGLVFPAGPLRETFSDQLARASALIVIGAGAPGEAAARAATGAGVEVLRASLVPGPGAPDLAGAPVVAFCAIARPEKFFASLEAVGARLAARIAFADHHPFGAGGVARILEMTARHGGAVPVTTEKDLVRLNDANDPQRRLRQVLKVLPVEIAFSEPDRLDALLRAALAARRE